MKKENEKEKKFVHPSILVLTKGPSIKSVTIKKNVDPSRGLESKGLGIALGYSNWKYL